jgi:WS/DGAT/MGAT family acyltransferase
MAASQRLSALDSCFLHMDSETLINQGAGLAIFEGRLDYDRVVQDVESKLGHVPRFRQIAVPVPLNLAHPTWEFDPHFGIRNHVHNVKLEPPGTEEQLRVQVGELLNTRLDRNKPLWAIYVIEGLEGGCSAVVGMIHHCLSDGIGAAALAGVMFDLEPDPPKQTWKPGKIQAIPGPARRIARAIKDDMIGAVRFWSGVPVGLYRLIWSLGSRKNREGRRIVRKFFKSPTVRFPYNNCLSGGLKLVWGEFPLDDMREIGRACGGTINDALLAAMTAVSERYGAEHGIDMAGRFHRVQVPASVRRPDQHGQLGNHVTIMPVLVPFGIKDTLERLATVASATRALKEHNVIKGISVAIEVIQTLLTPPGMVLVLKTLFSQRVQRISNRESSLPIVNTNVTNVPWPAIALHLAGRPVSSLIPLVPLLPGIGLSCGAFSYNQKLLVSFTGDAELIPEVDRILTYLDDAIAELREAVGVRTSAPTDASESACSPARAEGTPQPVKG